jgi:hypothetical protein
MSVEDQLSCGRPSTSKNDENVEKVHQAVLADRRQTIDKISEITDVSRSSCQRILTEDLMMKQVAAKFVICRKGSKMTLSFSQKL